MSYAEEDPPCDWCALLDRLNSQRILMENVTIRASKDAYVGAYMNGENVPFMRFEALPLTCLCGRRT